MKQSNMSLARKILLALLAALLAVGGLMGVLLLDRGVGATAEGGNSIVAAAADAAVTKADKLPNGSDFPEDTPYKSSLVAPKQFRAGGDPWSAPDEKVTVTYVNAKGIQYSLNGGAVQNGGTSLTVGAFKKGNKYYLPVSYGTDCKVLVSSRDVFYDDTVLTAENPIVFTVVDGGTEDIHIDENGHFYVYGYDKTGKAIDVFYFGATGMYTSTEAAETENTVDIAKLHYVKEAISQTLEDAINNALGENNVETETPSYTGSTVYSSLYEKTLKDNSDKFEITGVYASTNATGTLAENGGWTQTYPNKYTVKPINGYTWQDGEEDPKEISWGITRAAVNAHFKYDEGKTAYTFDVFETQDPQVTLTTADEKLFPEDVADWTFELQYGTTTGEIDTPDGYTFSLKAYIDEKIGRYTLTATFAGNQNLNGATVTATVNAVCSNGFVVTKDDVSTAYSTLAAAITAAKGTGTTATTATVKVNGNVTIKADDLNNAEVKKVTSLTLEGTEGSKVTLGDGVEKLVVGSKDGTAANALKLTSLTLKNLTFNGSIDVTAGGSLELNNVTFNGSINVETNGTLSLTNVTMKNGAIAAAKKDGTKVASLTLTGTNTFNNATISLLSGATMTASGNVVFKNTTATALSAVNATIATQESQTLDVKFTNCTAAENGGAIFLDEGATFAATSVTAENCKATTGNGGAVYVGVDCTFTVTTFTATGCSAQNGGAVYVGDYGKNKYPAFTVSGTFTAEDCSATNGGAIYVGGGNVMLNASSNNEFTNNTATQDGGAIYYSKGSLTVANASFTGNTAVNGGAIALVLYNAKVVKDYSVTLTSCTMNGNKATGKGGAIYASSNAAFTLDGGKIDGNTAQYGAGLALESGANVTLNAAAMSGLVDGVRLEGKESYITVAGDELTDAEKVTVEFADPEQQLGAVLAGGAYEQAPVYVKGTQASLNNYFTVKNDGYAFGSFSSGLYLLVPTENVVAVIVDDDGNYTPYTTLQAAIDAIETTGTIYLVEKTTLTLENTLVIKSGVTLTLSTAKKNGNTYTETGAKAAELTRSRALTAAMILVEEGATLTLKNITLNDCAHANDVDYEAVVLSKGTLTIAAGATINATANNAVKTEGNGTVTVTDAPTIRGTVYVANVGANAALDVTGYTDTTKKITVKFDLTDAAQTGKVAVGAIDKLTYENTAPSGLKDAFAYTYTDTNKTYLAVGKYALTVAQNELNKLTVSGTFDATSATAKVTGATGNATPLSQDFETTLTVATAPQGTVGLTFEFTYGSNKITVEVSDISVILLNKDANGVWTLYYPTDTQYKVGEEGELEQLNGTSCTLPNDMEGDVVFTMGTKEVTLNFGTRAAAPEAKKAKNVLTWTDATNNSLTFTVDPAYATGYEFSLNGKWTAPENGVLTFTGLTAGQAYDSLQFRAVATEGGLPGNTATLTVTYKTLTADQTAAKAAFDTKYNSMIGTNGQFTDNLKATDFTELFAAYTTLQSAFSSSMPEFLSTKYNNAQNAYYDLLANTWFNTYGTALKQAAKYVYGDNTFADVTATDDVTKLEKTLAEADKAYKAFAADVKDEVLNRLAAKFTQNAFTYTSAGKTYTMSLWDANTAYLQVAMKSVMNEIATLDNDPVTVFYTAILARLADEDVDTIEEAQAIEADLEKGLAAADVIKTAYDDAAKDLPASSAAKKLLDAKLASMYADLAESNLDTNLQDLQKNAVAQFAFAKTQGTAQDTFVEAYKAIYGDDNADKALKGQVGQKYNDLAAQTTEAALIKTLKAAVQFMLTPDCGAYNTLQDSQAVVSYLTTVSANVGNATGDTTEKAFAAILNAVQKTKINDKDTEGKVVDKLASLRASFKLEAATQYANLVKLLGRTLDTDDAAYKAINGADNCYAANTLLGQKAVDLVKTLSNDRSSELLKNYVAALTKAIEDAVKAANTTGKIVVAGVYAAAYRVANERLEASKTKAKEELKNYFKALKGVDEAALATNEEYKTISGNLTKDLPTVTLAKIGDTVTETGVITTALNGVNNALKTAARSVLDSLIQKEDGKQVDSTAISSTVYGFQTDIDSDTNVDDYYGLCSAILQLQENGKLADETAGTDAVKSVTAQLNDIHTKEKTAAQKAYDDIKALFNNAEKTIDGDNITELNNNLAAAVKALFDTKLTKEGEVCKDSQEVQDAVKTAQNAIDAETTLKNNSHEAVILMPIVNEHLANIGKEQETEQKNAIAAFNAVYKYLTGSEADYVSDATKSWDEEYNAISAATTATDLNAAVKAAVEALLDSYKNSVASSLVSNNSFVDTAKTNLENEVFKDAANVIVTGEELTEELGKISLKENLELVDYKNEKIEEVNELGQKLTACGVDSTAACNTAVTNIKAVAAVGTENDLTTAKGLVDEAVTNCVEALITNSNEEKVALEQYKDAYYAIYGTQVNETSDDAFKTFRDTTIKGKSADEINVSLKTAIQALLNNRAIKAANDVDSTDVTTLDQITEGAYPMVYALYMNGLNSIAATQKAFAHSNIDDYASLVEGVNNKFTLATEQDKALKELKTALDGFQADFGSVTNDWNEFSGEKYTTAIEDVKKQETVENVKKVVDSFKLEGYKYIAYKEYAESLVAAGVGLGDAQDSDLRTALADVKVETALNSAIETINSTLAEQIKAGLDKAFAKHSTVVKGYLTTLENAITGTTDVAGKINDFSAKIANAKIGDVSFTDAVSSQLENERGAAIEVYKAYYAALVGEDYKDAEPYKSIVEKFATATNCTVLVDLLEQYIGKYDAENEAYTDVQALFNGVAQANSTSSNYVKGLISAALETFTAKITAVRSEENANSIPDKTLDSKVDSLLQDIKDRQKAETDKAKEFLGEFVKGLTNEDHVPQDGDPLKGTYDNALTTIVDSTTYNTTKHNLLTAIGALINKYVEGKAGSIPNLVVTLKTKIHDGINATNDIQVNAESDALTGAMVKAYGAEVHFKVAFTEDRDAKLAALKDAYDAAIAKGGTRLNNDAKAAINGLWTNTSETKGAKETIEAINIADATTAEGWLANYATAQATLTSTYDGYMPAGKADIFEQASREYIAQYEYAESYKIVYGTDTFTPDAAFNNFKTSIAGKTATDINTSLTGTVASWLEGLKAKASSTIAEYLQEQANVIKAMNSSDSIVALVATVTETMSKVNDDIEDAIGDIADAYKSAYNALTGADADENVEPAKSALAAITDAADCTAANEQLKQHLVLLLLGVNSSAAEEFAPATYTLLKEGDSATVTGFLKAAAEAIEVHITGGDVPAFTGLHVFGHADVTTLAAIKTTLENLRKAAYDAAVDEYLKEYKVAYGESSGKTDDQIKAIATAELGEDTNITVTAVNVALRTLITNLVDGLVDKDADSSLIKALVDPAKESIEENTATLVGATEVLDFATIVEKFAADLNTLKVAERTDAINQYLRFYSLIALTNATYAYETSTLTGERAADTTLLKAGIDSIKDAANTTSVSAALKTAMKGLLGLMKEEGDAQEVTVYLDGTEEDQAKQLIDAVTAVTATEVADMFETCNAIDTQVKAYRNAEKVNALTQYINAYNLINKTHLYLESATLSVESDVEEEAVVGAVQTVLSGIISARSASAINAALVTALKDLVQSMYVNDTTTGDSKAVQDTITAQVALIKADGNCAPDANTGISTFITVSEDGTVSGLIADIDEAIKGARTADITAAKTAYVAIYNALKGTNETTTTLKSKLDTAFESVVTAGDANVELTELVTALVGESGELITGTGVVDSQAVIEFLKTVGVAINAAINKVNTTTAESNTRTVFSETATDITYKDGTSEADVSKKLTGENSVDDAIKALRLKDAAKAQASYLAAYNALNKTSLTAPSDALKKTYDALGAAANAKAAYDMLKTLLGELLLGKTTGQGTSATTDYTLSVLKDTDAKSLKDYLEQVKSGLEALFTHNSGAYEIPEIKADTKFSVSGTADQTFALVLAQVTTKRAEEKTNALNAYITVFNTLVENILERKTSGTNQKLGLTAAASAAHKTIPAYAQTAFDNILAAENTKAAYTALMNAITALINDQLKTTGDSAKVTALYNDILNALVGKAKEGNTPAVVGQIVNGSVNDREIKNLDSTFVKFTGETVGKTLADAIAAVEDQKDAEITAVANEFESAYKAIKRIATNEQDADVSAEKGEFSNKLNGTVAGYTKVKNIGEANALLVSEIHKLLTELLKQQGQDTLDAKEVKDYLTGEGVGTALDALQKAENTATNSQVKNLTKAITGTIKAKLDALRASEKDTAIKEYLAAYQAFKGIELTVNENGYVKIVGTFDEGIAGMAQEDVIAMAQAVVNAINKAEHAKGANDALLNGVYELIDALALEGDSAKVYEAIAAAKKQLGEVDVTDVANGITDIVAEVAEGEKDLATELKDQIAARRAQDITDAKQAYLDVYNVLMNAEETLETEDEALAAVLNTIGAEEVAKAANEALKAALDALFDGMTGESANVTAYLGKLKAALGEMIEKLNGEAARKVPELTTEEPDKFMLDGEETTLAAVKTAFDAMKTAERTAALEEYKALYEVVVGKAYADTDEEAKAAVDALNAATNADEANAALVAGVKALLARLQLDGDSANVEKAVADGCAALDGIEPADNGIVELTETVNSTIKAVTAARAADIAAIVKAYVDAYKALRGEKDGTVAETASKFKAELETKKATTAGAANAVLKAQLDALLGTMSSEGDSAIIKDFFADLQKKIDDAIDAAITAKTIPDLSAIVEGRKAELDTMKAAELEAAKAAYLKYYEAFTGEKLGGNYNDTVNAVLAELEAAKDNKALNDTLKKAIDALFAAETKNDAKTVQDVAKAQQKVIDDAIDAATTAGDGATDLADALKAAKEEIELQRYKDNVLAAIESAYKAVETGRMEANTKTELETYKTDATTKANGVKLDEGTSLLDAKESLDEILATAKNNFLRKGAEGVAKQEYLATYEAVTGTKLGNTIPADVQAVLDNFKALAQDDRMDDFVDAVNNALGRAVKALLEGLLVKDGSVLKDSQEVKAIVVEAQNAVADMIAGVAAGKIPAISTLAQIKSVKANVDSKRAEEKAEASGTIDDTLGDLTGDKTYSDETQGKIDDLVEAAKEKLENANYADIPVIQEQLKGQIELLNKLSELEARAKTDGLDIADVKASIESSIEALNGTTSEAETKKATADAILTAEKEYAKDVIEDFTKNDSDAVKSVLEGPNGFNAKFDAAKDDAAVQALIEEAKTAVKGERWAEQYKGLNDPFNNLGAAGKESLQNAKDQFNSLDAATKAYLNESSEYTSFEKEIEDRLNKADFESKKDDAISELEELAASNSGAYVREVLEEQLGKLDAVRYAAQLKDGERDSYKNAQTQALANALNAAKAEVTLAQSVQTNSNAAEAILNDHLASGNYNAEQKDQLKKLFSDFCAEAKEIPAGANAEADLKALYEMTLAGFDEVPVVAVTSGELKANGDAADYPDNFDDNKLWGIVTNDTTMEGGLELSIEMKDGKTMDTIDDARKNGKLVAAKGSSLKTEDLKDMVSGKDVVSTFDINLLKKSVKVTAFNGLYTVKVLLPESMRDLEGLQVVYEGSNGVEVYETKIEDGKYLVFTTEHFSEFTVLADSATNLWWLVITLTALLGVELVALLVVLLKKGGKKKETKAASVLPIGLLAAFAPVNAVVICILLGVFAVGLGVLIFFLAKPKKSEKKAEAKAETK